MRDLDEATRKLAEATVAIPTVAESPQWFVTHCEEERDECEEQRDECERDHDRAMKNLAHCRVVRDRRVTERDVAIRVLVEHRRKMRELGTGPPVPSREVWGMIH